MYSSVFVAASYLIDKNYSLYHSFVVASFVVAFPTVYMYVTYYVHSVGIKRLNLLQL